MSLNLGAAATYYMQDETGWGVHEHEPPPEEAICPRCKHPFGEHEWQRSHNGCPSPDSACGLAIQDDGVTFALQYVNKETRCNDEFLAEISS